MRFLITIFFIFLVSCASNTSNSNDNHHQVQPIEDLKDINFTDLDFNVAGTVITGTLENTTTLDISGIVGTVDGFGVITMNTSGGVTPPVGDIYFTGSINNDLEASGDLGINPGDKLPW